MKKLLSLLGPDPFLVLLVGTVSLATVLPCRDEGARIFAWITDAGITLLFFFHGAKLSRQTLLAGAGHWSLHLLVGASTFVLFPLLGLAVRALGRGWMDPNMAAGVVFLCLLPSTVQSSIAFTSIARGNVPAAVCTAAFSNMAGVFITPLLVTAFLAARLGDHESGLRSIESIALEILAPFIVGHLCRPLILGIIERHRRLVGSVDRGSILLVVYTAFSAAVIQGLWRSVSTADLALVVVIDVALLVIVLVCTRTVARILGFSKEDEITIVFCGSKKSLASGVPIAKVLFPTAAVGPIILPLMLFHQIQLMACAVIARRYAMRAQRRSDGSTVAAQSSPG
ncbi:MAG TPA: bile acid:sodium symporter family protein [Terriglobales bacterium]|nr:bile acid:sodium symporter family protein [Terriglobales bacterium]